LALWTFAFAVAFVTGIVFGLAPALQGPKAELRDALHLKVSGGQAPAARLRDCSDCWLSRKVALSGVLLIGAALLIQTFWRLQHESPGFDARDVLTAQMTLDDQRFSKTAAVARLEDQALTGLESLPGVKAAATVSNLPFEPGADMNFAIQRETHREAIPAEAPSGGAITPHYLQVMRIPVLRGRGLTDRDNASEAPVVLINQAVAERFFPVKIHSGSML